MTQRHKSGPGRDVPFIDHLGIAIEHAQGGTSRVAIGLRPAGGRLVATGRATGGGRSVCFCEARITDERGALAAQEMGTFRFRDPA